MKSPCLKTVTVGFFKDGIIHAFQVNASPEQRFKHLDFSLVLQKLWILSVLFIWTLFSAPPMCKLKSNEATGSCNANQLTWCRTPSVLEAVHKNTVYRKNMQLINHKEWIVAATLCLVFLMRSLFAPCLHCTCQSLVQICLPNYFQWSPPAGCQSFRWHYNTIQEQF